MLARNSRRPAILLQALSFFAVAAIGQPMAAGANVPGSSNAQAPASDNVTRARDAVKRGDLRVATLLLKNAIQADPRNGTIKVELGNVLVMQGQMAQAEQILRQARAQGAPDSAVLPGLFQAMLSQRESQAVLDQFPEPSDRSQTAVDTLRARALAFFSLKNQEAADAQLDKALAIRRTPPLLVNKAEFAIARENRQQANAFTDEALRIAPQDRNALIMKLGLLQRSGDFAGALEFANRLVRTSQNDPLPLVLRIEVLAKLQRDKDAEADVNKLLAMAPNMPIALYDRALLLARKGDIKGAWQIAQGLPPDFIHSAPQFGLGYAQIAAASGNREVSEAALSAVISAYPSNEQARTELAERRLAQKNYASALEILQPISSTSDPRVLMLIGNTYQGMGRVQQANDYFGRARVAGAARATAAPAGASLDNLRGMIAKDPANSEAVGALIVVLIGQGRSDEARKVADNFERAAPSNSRKAYFQGQVSMARGDLDGAAEQFSAALATDRNFIPALYYRAQVAAARGDLDAANRDLDAILRNEPQNAQALAKRAQYAVEMGQDNVALALLKRAEKASPKSAEPQLALAEFYLARKRYGEALAISSAAVTNFPDDARLVSTLVRSHLGLNAPDRARMAAERLAAAKPNFAGAQLLLAATLEQTKDQKGALAAYLAATRADPKQPAAYGALASYYLRHGQADKMVEISQALAQKAPSSESDLLLADALSRSGNSAAARSVLEKGLAVRPNSRVVLALVAIQMKSDRKGAERRLAQWISTHDRDVAARSQLANMLLADGNFTAAKAQLETVIRYQPYNASALNDLAWMVQKTESARAIKLASLAVRLSPRSGEILDTLAWMKWQQKNSGENLALLQRAHALSPAEPNIAYHLALALDGSGNRAAARDKLQIALKPNAALTNRAEAQKLQLLWK